MSGPENSQPAINAVIAPWLGASVELYKSNAGGSDEGSFAAEYTTAFMPTADPSDALIDFTGSTATFWFGTRSPGAGTS